MCLGSSGLRGSSDIDRALKEVVEKRRAFFPVELLERGFCMARTKLTQQGDYEFHLSLFVQPRDVNYAGHLSNDALISLVGTARALMLHDMGLSEMDLGDGRTGIVMTDLVVNYRGEAFMFDELLLETHVGDFTRTSFRMFHRATKESALVALIETGLVAFDYASRRVVPVPAPFIKAVAARKALSSS